MKMNSSTEYSPVELLQETSTPSSASGSSQDALLGVLDCEERCSIIEDLPVSRRKEYKRLKHEAKSKEPFAFPTPEQEYAPREWRDALEDRSSKRFFVEANGKLVGMIEAKTSFELGPFGIYDLDNGDTGGIYRFYVNKKYREKGLSRQLLEKALTWLEKDPAIKKIQLQVVATQEKARALYEKYGFYTIGERAPSKLQPYTLYLMERSIKYFA